MVSSWLNNDKEYDDVQGYSGDLCSVLYVGGIWY